MEAFGKKADKKRNRPKSNKETRTDGQTPEKKAGREKNKENKTGEVPRDPSMPSFGQEEEFRKQLNGESEEALDGKRRNLVQKDQLGNVKRQERSL